MQFKEIIGQEPVKKHLIDTVKEKRISHAQLFLGPEGSGNLPLAIAYAQYIFCTNKDEYDACGTCPSCKKVQAFSHPDLHFSYPIHLQKSTRTSDDVFADWKKQLETSIYFSVQDWYKTLGNDNKQGTIGTEESQRIVKKIALKSYEGGYKILIMWLPEMMNLQASNKLLKIIEEPPKDTLFLLVSENQEKIIPTILSRTQLVKVPRLKEAILTDYLIREKGLPKNEAETFAHLSEGNVALAFSLMENKEQASFNLDNFIKWMRLCYMRNVGETIDWVDSMASAGRETQKNFLVFTLGMFRQSIVGHYTNSELVVLTEAQQQFLEKFAPFINHKNILPLTEVINDAYYHLERNANPKILLLDVSLKIFAYLKRKV